MRHAFYHSPSVGEDQRCAVGLNQLRQTTINFFPHFIRHHGFKRRLGNFNRQVQLAAVTDVDDRAIRVASLIDGMCTNQETRNFLDRFLRRGQADALEWMLC